MNPLFHHLFQRTRYLSKELNHILKEFDLYASQWSILYCVHHNGKMNLTDIWTYLNVEAPTVTRTVNRLVDLNWLTILPGQDRRQKVVALSEDAIQRFPEVESAIISFEARFLEKLTQDEQKQLTLLLSKIQKD